MKTKVKDQKFADVEAAYLQQLATKLSLLKSEEKINQHRQRKIKALMNMISA